MGTYEVFITAFALAACLTALYLTLLRIIKSEIKKQIAVFAVKRLERISHPADSQIKKNL